jgi:hypothetical protein
MSRESAECSVSDDGTHVRTARGDRASGRICCVGHGDQEESSTPMAKGGPRDYMPGMTKGEWWAGRPSWCSARRLALRTRCMKPRLRWSKFSCPVLSMTIMPITHPRTKSCGVMKQVRRQIIDQAYRSHKMTLGGDAHWVQVPRDSSAFLYLVLLVVSARFGLSREYYVSNQMRLLGKRETRIRRRAPPQSCFRRGADRPTGMIARTFSPI